MANPPRTRLRACPFTHITQNDTKHQFKTKHNRDGLKVDDKGNLWATGPGGVLVLTPEGKVLGTLLTGGWRVFGAVACVGTSPTQRQPPTTTTKTIQSTHKPPTHQKQTTTTGKKTANVAWGGDGHLYVCADDVVARIPVLAKPAPAPPKVGPPPAVVGVKEGGGLRGGEGAAACVGPDGAVGGC